MDVLVELIIVSKLAVALLLGGFIGFDRERAGTSAGIRTYAAVCLAAALFTLLSARLDDPSGAGRVVSGIIEGIGFLGAGIIFRDRSSDTVQGLTTAATVWGTAAVGVAVGLNLFIIAVASAVALYALLSIERFRWYRRWKKDVQEEEKEADPSAP